MDTASTFYLTQGVLGVTVVVLAFVVVKLYNRTVELQNLISALLKEAKDEAVTTTKEVTTVMRDSSQSMALLAEKIEVSKQNGRNS